MRSYIHPSSSSATTATRCLNSMQLGGLEFCTINATCMFCGKGGPDEIPSSKHPNPSGADGTTHAASPTAWCATAAQDKNLSKGTELQPVLQCNYLPRRGIIKLQITFSVLNWTSKSDRTFFKERDSLKNLIDNCQHLCFPHEGLCLKFLFYSPVGNHWFYFSYRKHVLS